MKAVLMTDTGSPDVLKITEVEEPRILEPRQIKVKLKAAGVNPIDTKLRKGGLFYDNALPAILGCDGAGVVEEVGPGATRFQPGDNVWFCHGGLGKEPGNYAQYTVLDERWAAPLPSSVSFEEAAAAPLVLITAWGALYERGGLLPGQTVLIHAGAGGVGHVAIQLAKLRGARVITTVSTEEKGEFVRRLGADEVIFYQRENFADHVNRMTGGEGANLVFDTVGPEVFVSSIVATAHFGSLVTLLNPGRIDLQEARMRNLKIGFELMLTPMLRNLDAARDKHVKILNRCGEWMEQKQLAVEVNRILELDQAVEAHRRIESGHTQGKIVLAI